MEILKDLNFVQWLLTVLFTALVWNFQRAVSRFDSSVKDLYEKYGGHDTRLSRVETVHDLKGCDTVEKRRKA
jgi:Ca2+-dependent lipid-binding protein